MKEGGFTHSKVAVYVPIVWVTIKSAWSYKIHAYYLAELLRAVIISRPHIFENLVTHLSKKNGCNVTIRTFVQPSKGFSPKNQDGQVYSVHL